MLATGIAAALTAGSTAPAGAVPGHVTGAATAAGTTAGTTLTGQGKTWITLITGDQVAVDAKGKPVGLRHAKGREHIPIQVERLAGHTYLIPQDAAQLIREGQVDRRLFDITTLSRAEYRKAQRNGLGFIVTYKGASPAAKAELHAADGTVVTHTFKHLGGEAVTTKKQDAADVWAALTNQPSGSPFATAESGLKTVWLDAVQKAALDKSVPQIGAPTAWAAGYDGKGVKIAVLDTGVDKTHPDLATQVVDEKNFSTAATVVDHFGHGTHVASIAAGTGAKSGGKYKGVAPGAQIISGKVLDDDGYGDDAGIIAGLEWAAASGAKVANLSLGGTDTPGVDPIEAAVNTLSASTGTLFVIAAGNSGPEAGSVGSPGSADAALTVGAVDKSNVLADFSSRGPRVGDGAIKPDLTAPGVDITAAAAPGSVIDTDPSVPHPAPGYLTISGTSMATPHVSGAAAILAEEHPDWTGQQIKEALVGSAKGFAYNAFQQGSGRVDLTTAIKQTVVADQVSLSFGTAQWPHNDDPKIDKKVTYRNLGTTDVTLDLSLAATDPKGNAAPTGFFTLDQTQVTVPAGGTAEATVTADSTLGGSVDGSYSAYVTATATDGSQTVRTAAAVNREVESYDITVKHIGRDGQPTKVYNTDLFGLTGSAAGLYFAPYDASGTATIRVPKGRYVLASNVYVGDGQTWQGADWIAQPRLDATKNTTVTVDARTAKPVDLTVPDKSATSQFASIDFSVITGHSGVGVGWWLDSYQNFRTAHLGPATAAGELTETVQSTWSHGSGTEYDLAYGFKNTKLLTGYTKHTKAKELSKVNVKEGAPAKNKLGYLFATPDTGSGGSSSIAFQRTLPYTGKVYLGGSGTKWSFDFEQAAADTFDFEADYSTSPATYVAGRTYDRVFNVGVFGPKLSKPFGLFRNGNQIYGYLPLLADGQNRTGASAYTAAKTSLYRNGKLVGSNTDPVTGEPFTVPSGNASYKLSTWITRSSKLSAVSTRVTAAWTFSSKKGTAQLPASVVRFTPALSTSSTAKAKAKLSVPVSVQGSAAGKNLKSLRVYVSFDGGKKWTKLTVKKGKVTVTNPKAGKGVSFKALVTDKKGNTLSQVIYNAYLTK